MRFTVSPGQVFGRLTVLSEVRLPPSGIRAAKGYSGLWAARCRCTCGEETVVLLGNLSSRQVLSCGCGRVTHGLYQHPQRARWSKMMSRCYNTMDSDYATYGGRGITVDPRWQSIHTFASDLDTIGLLVEPPICGLVESAYPPDGYSLDRIDSDGPYSLANTRWASSAVQSRNRGYVTMSWSAVEDIRRRNRPGRGGNTRELAAEYGVTAHHIRNIAARRSWVRP